MTLSDINLDKKSLLEWAAGNYSSSWGFLCISAASSLITSIAQSDKFFDLFKTKVQSDTEGKAEVEALLSLNYQVNLSGPLFSTVVTSAFAIESFMRLAFQLYLDIKLNKKKTDRAKEIAPIYESNIKKFDKLTSLEKINQIIKIFETPPLDANLQKHIEALIFFRNDCAHDDPVVDLKDGSTKRVKKGTVKEVDISNIYHSLFNPLWASNYPIRLIHALTAIDTHDKFVSHVLKTTKDERLISNLSEVIGLAVKGNGEPYLILDFIPQKDQWALENLFSFAELWENDIQTFTKSISLKERHDFITDLKRKLTIKVVE